jgi:hypothetical protein
MKTNHLAFDDVADSMSAAAGRTGIPIGVIRAAKRGGCDAFRGSRVNLARLREWLVSAEKEPTLSDVLMSTLEEVATIIADKKSTA